MRLLWLLLFSCCIQSLHAQTGTLAGNVLDEKGKALENATAELSLLNDSTARQTTATDKNGAFAFQQISAGYYRLRVSYVSLQAAVIDSLYFRKERMDFNLADMVLKPATNNSLDEVIIYAERPLIQSKEGNITFNASESALSQGSNASDLLTQVPLVTKDPNGKVLVRGKEPKILIDDKPVELNLQQLQDMLESMPGSSIEKIEVMTNPPPQYATEQGGVINIVTRKGSVGITGRLSVYAGTRGETGTNGGFNYRKQGLAINVNAGAVHNRFEGEGYSIRQNIYTDSTNFFKTENRYVNASLRPNFRANVDYEISRYHLINVVLQYNQNRFDNSSNTAYRNINRFDELYRLSERTVASAGDNYNPNVSINYTLKTKKPGETVRLFTAFNFSDNGSQRNFYQQFFNPDYTFNGNDSTQVQLTDNTSKGYNLRLSYDKPLSNKSTFLSLGGYYNHSFSDVDVNALYRRKGDGVMVGLDVLSNYFLFYQNITNVRASVRQLFGKSFSTTAGLAAEETSIRFDLLKAGRDTANSYWTLLPFANLNKTWSNNLNLTFSYRRTLRRPGINELNPTRDFSDPYNIRAGNPALIASPAHNFDVVLGKNKGALYANIGVGYNIVEAIFNPIRQLLADGTTEIIWQNISGRKEYEISTWSGYTFVKKWRVNVSASYTFSQYSDYDKQYRRYRDGGSLTSNFNTNYTFKELYTATGNVTFNRFANPQGTVRSNVSVNLGLQAKMMRKKITLSLNVIDPITQQQNRSFTYGTNFALENFSTTQTRNYRLTVGYNFSKTIRKPIAKSIAPKKTK